MFSLVCFFIIRVHENGIYNFPQSRISGQVWMEFTGSKLRCHLNTPVTHWGAVIVREYGSPQSTLKNRAHLCGLQTTSPVFPGWGSRRMDIQCLHTHHTRLQPHANPHSAAFGGLSSLMCPFASCWKPRLSVQTPLIDVHQVNTLFPKQHFFLPQCHSSF